MDRPEKVDFDSVRAALAHVVPLCLDGDPSLVPSSTTASTSNDGGDPDDFRFWSERQAWRIARSVREMFGVEYAPDVVMADANLSALAQRIIASRARLRSESSHLARLSWSDTRDRVCLEVFRWTTRDWLVGT